MRCWDDEPEPEHEPEPGFNFHYYPSHQQYMDMIAIQQSNNFHNTDSFMDSSTPPSLPPPVQVSGSPSSSVAPVGNFDTISPPFIDFLGVGAT